MVCGQRLAIISGHADELAARLLDTEFVRTTGDGDITWSVIARVPCPPVNHHKTPHWPRMRDGLFAAEWDLLLCSAVSLSAILCDQTREMAPKAIDIGATDEVLTKQKRLRQQTAVTRLYYFEAALLPVHKKCVWSFINQFERYTRCRCD